MMCHCNCIAGLAESCTHVAAILFTLEFACKEQRSVTDVLAYWVGPKSNKTFSKKIVGVDFTCKVTTTPTADTPSNTEQLPDLSESEMESFLKEYHDDGGVSVLHSLYEDSLPKCSSDTSLLLSDLYDDKYRAMPLTEIKILGGNVTVFVNESQRAEIELSTRQQSKNKKWFLLRAGRITASNLKDICHTKITKPSVSLLKRVCYPHLYKRTFAAGKFYHYVQNKLLLLNVVGVYGCTHERDAIKDFLAHHQKEHPNSSVEKCGLFIHEEFPKFAATPDGILNCDICGQGCIEVKCPFCARDTSVSELIKIKKTCLIPGDQTVLDKKHKYFYQIQMQMALSKTKFCYFIMWSPKDFFVEKVNFDSNFWQEKSAKALLFHREVILPELLAKYYTLPLEKDESQPSFSSKDDSQPSTSTDVTEVMETDPEVMETDPEVEVCICFYSSGPSAIYLILNFRYGAIVASRMTENKWYYVPIKSAE